MSDSSKPSEGLNQAASLANSLFEIIKNYGLPIATCTVITVTAFPVAKIGPGRALGLFLRSFIGKPSVVSQRTRDLKNLKEKIFATYRPGPFLVVQGPKGIGKTTAIETVLHRQPGVIYLSDVSPSRSKEKIVESVMTEITNIRFKVMDNQKATARVLMWYKFIGMLFGRQEPIVVIRAMGRNVDQPATELADAARALSDIGLRVVLDCSDGAVSNKEIEREDVYRMERMPDDLLNQLASQPLVAFLNNTGNYDLIMQMCRGVPSLLYNLEDKWKVATDDSSRSKAIEDFVREQLFDAMKHCTDIRSKPNVKEILEGCVGVPNLKFLADPVADRLPGVDFHKVFRVIKTGDMKMLVPSSSVMETLLRGGTCSANLELNKSLVASWKQLEDLVDFLRQNDDYKLVVEICRGKQDAWSRLEKRWREVKGDEAKKTAVRLFVRDELVTAIQEKNRNVNKFPQIKDSLELFKSDVNSRLPVENIARVPSSMIRSLLVVRIVDGKEVYVPRSPTMAIVLAAGLGNGAQLAFDFDESKPENSLSFDDVKQILESWTERDISIVY